MIDKVYIVKSSFGRYEDACDVVEGVFLTEQQANNLKTVIDNDVQKLRELDDVLVYDNMNKKDWKKYSELYSFFRCDTEEYIDTKIEILDVGSKYISYIDKILKK